MPDNTDATTNESIMIRIMLGPDEKRRLRIAAARAEVSITEFVRRAAIEALVKSEEAS